MTRNSSRFHPVDLAKRTAPNRICLINPQTGLWLHQSGVSETASLDHEWVGTKPQARALRNAAKKAQGEWPYTLGDPKTGIPVDPRQRGGTK